MEGEAAVIDEEVTAVVLAVITVIAAIVGVGTFLPSRTSERFSELGVLGPNMKIGDYPRELVTGENFTLYVYVGNHEGHVMYYRVLIKLGNETDSISEDEPVNAEVLLSRDFILKSGGNYTKPVTLSIDKPGINQRLVFELWAYEPGSRMFKYHSRWCQLWLNVTAPA